MIFLSVITFLVFLVICCLPLFIKQNNLSSENELLRMELNALKKKLMARIMVQISKMDLNLISNNRLTQVMKAISALN